MLLDFVRQGYFAFQDYAIAHWPDHVITFIKASTYKAQGNSIEGYENAGAFLLFVDRYDRDLSKLDAGQDSLATGDGGDSQLVEGDPNMAILWKHANYIRTLFDDRRDEVSLLSLATNLKINRSLLEGLSKPAAQRNGDLMALRDFYGEKWFECAKLSCYYFHEGFATRSARQAHYDRHDRPFKCDQDDCLSAIIGFGSLKELEKHKRNIHPGIDKLSSTSKRLKKGDDGAVAVRNHVCPRCSLRFASRLQCRLHMHLHTRLVAPKNVGETA